MLELCGSDHPCLPLPPLTCELRVLPQPHEENASGAVEDSSRKLGHTGL